MVFSMCLEEHALRLTMLAMAFQDSLQVRIQ